MHLWIIVVPVLAHMLARVNGEIVLRVLETAVVIDLSLPFSWQLFYFSALAFSVGNAIYLSRCPRIVQDHDNPSEFHGAGKGFDQIVHYGMDAGLQETAIQEHVNTTNEQVVAIEKRYNRLFWIFYNHANKARAGALSGAAGFYALGFALIGVVLFQNLWLVLKLILDGVVASGG